MNDTVERVVPGTLSWDMFGYEHIQRYDFFAPLCEGKIVLDAACGTGYGSHCLLEKGKAEKVTGIDISKEAIDFSSKYKSDQLQFMQLDCLKLNELNEKYDIIISFETIEHVNDPELFIRKAAEALKSGGRFVCSTPNKDRLSGAGNINPFHPSELTYEEFHNAFSRYFTIEKTFHQSESVSYSRYLEIKHMLSKMNGRMSAYALNRIETGIRKSLNKSFSYDPYLRDDLEHLFEGDMEIVELTNGPKKWHKTFILQGRLK